MKMTTVMPDKPELNLGGRVYLPEHMLMTCLRDLRGGEMTSALLFKLEVDDRATHVGCVEFTAEPGKIYVPDWVWEALQPRDRVLVTLANLPRAKRLLIQPLDPDYMRLNQKVVLETRLRSFSALTKSDVIPIEFNGSVFKLKILEVEPQNAVDITECNVEIDFVVADVEKVEPRDCSPDESWTVGLLIFARNLALNNVKKPDKKLDRFPGNGKPLE